MGASSSCSNNGTKGFEVRVRVDGCEEGRVIGPHGDGHVEVVLDSGRVQSMPRQSIDIISEDLSAGMRVKAKEDSADNGKWYKAGEEGEVVGRSSMGQERVQVQFGNNRGPQQPPRRRLDVLSPLRAPGQGMKTVLLMRHGRAKHNDDMRNQDAYPDAELTDLGVAQAAAWADGFSSFSDVIGKVEIILVSPLQRTIQTACHAFARSSFPMQLCMPAREGWFKRLCNQPLTVEKPDEFQQLLDSLPDGREKIDASTMIRAPKWEKQASSEEESMQHLRFILATHEASTLVLVTHAGVIQKLTGMDVDNCTMLECALFEHWQSPTLKCIQKHATPHTAQLKSSST